MCGGVDLDANSMVCVEASHRNVFIGIIGAFWCTLDVMTTYVVYESSTGTTDIKYLTTQAWLFGFLAKLFLVMHLWKSPGITAGKITLWWIVMNIGWICFILYGTLQIAVMFTFFALLAMDSTLLSAAMQLHNISMIITWNHLRHVTPVFFYLMLMTFLGPDLAKRVEPDPPLKSNTFSEKKFVVLSLVIGCGLLSGALHHYFIDDPKLYMYESGHADVDQNCIIVFSMSVILASVYCIYGIIK